MSWVARAGGKRAGPAGSPSREAGVVLLLVLWVLALLSALILSFAREWRTELVLADNYRQTRQCRRLAEAGIYYGLGKLLENKLAETAPLRQSASLSGSPAPAQGWRPDQTPHVLEIAEGRVEVRIADEAGKINLNQASEKILTSLFAVLGYQEGEIAGLVDAILDWRSRGGAPRPLGGKDEYYGRLEPPYPAKNGRFDLVEELGWVRWFRGSPVLPRLWEWLTVATTGQQVNVNTAPREVLLALGLSPEQVAAVVQARQAALLRQWREVSPLGATPEPPSPLRGLGFQSSPFFTILSQGMVNNGQGRYTIKAMVRLEVASPTPWRIVSWYDDYPG